MKVALIGITGRVGTRVAAELLERGHTVTGIVRNPERVEAETGLSVVKGDAADPASLAPVLAGHDAVISAGRFVSMDAAKLIDAVKQAKVPRLLVVGGAGSLEIAPGKALIDTPEFPEAYKPEASAGRVFLQVLRAEPKDSPLNWTFLSPSALFEPGERTGKFRVGGDGLLVDANGKSWISMEDYAIALVDELEKNQHPRARFTVGY
ncbi:NAD(P)-dependent oxidoreductase [Pandoraea apista]|uniref:NAD(P)-dependent oxidoreductase n=1 Tax=Pandoraea apista TaxID=93218 RepID=UPI00058AA994|nr:NAD(P)-dependent oxidoreductase [Pandoraea apista]AJE98529.1 3-beta hydroxysteroid dehydrogenase [Pandoraea apista]AKH72589.1 3-beta hydroxysteroid dehydrogenase [Pandoraea apista]AKI60976.1 3-beta hydroxysteroid dehydrogenase [Pandoraea apista]